MPPPLDLCPTTVDDRLSRAEQRYWEEYWRGSDLSPVEFANLVRHLAGLDPLPRKGDVR